jgi:hydrogenase maturation protein HypF
VLHTISTDAALTDSLITKHLPQSQRELFARLCESGLQSPLTSSAGRLFDAAAGLLGICYDVTYEGRAAILLEQAARKWQKQESPLPMDFSKNATGLMQLNYESIFITLQQMRDQGIDICRLAYIFHLSLASGIANLCSELCHTYKCQIVALSGGVFQNQLLTEKLIHLLKQAGLSPKLPKQLPVNDGCIAYGQAVVALAGM